MKILKLTLLLCAALPLIALSQSNYRQGYVIKNNGDTLKGYINYREWSESPKSIQFKQNTADKQPVIFDVPAIKSFRINGMDSYTSYIGSITTGRIFSNTDLSHSLDTAVKQDSAFLKVISTGANITLLYHADKIKYRYFILETGKSAPYELKFYQYLDNDRIISEAPYIDQIDFLLKKYTKTNISQTGRVSNENYKEDAIVRYAKLINNNQSVDVSRSSGIRFFVGAAAAYNISNFSGPAGFGFASNSSSVTPSIDLGVDLLNNPNIQKSFFRLEFSLVSFSPTFNGTVAYFTSKQLVAAITPQIIINLYNTEKLKYFVDAGVGLAFTSVTDSKLVATTSGVILTPLSLQNQGDSFQSLQAGHSIANPYNVGNIGISILLKTGIVVNKKSEIYIGVIPYSLGGGDAGYTYENLRISLGYNYLFGSK